LNFALSLSSLPSEINYIEEKLKLSTTT